MLANASRAAIPKSPVTAKPKVLPPARALATQSSTVGARFARRGVMQPRSGRRRFAIPEAHRHLHTSNQVSAVASISGAAPRPVLSDTIFSGAQLLKAFHDLPRRETAPPHLSPGIDLHPWSFSDHQQKSDDVKHAGPTAATKSPAGIIQFAQSPTTQVFAPPALALLRPTAPPAKTHSLARIDSTSITSTGEPLPVAVCNPLARTFSVNLEPIRVHTDARAQRVVRSLSTRAFAYGHEIFLGAGEQPTDLRLIAHEVAHVIQQSHGATLQHFTSGSADSCEQEAERASAAAMRGESFTVRQRTEPRPQGLFGISLPNPLTWLANRANNIPGFRMVTVILGRNPINGQEVPRSAANIFRAIVGFIPGGELIIQALDNYGIFDRVGNWVEQQINSLGMTAGLIRRAVTDFIGSLTASDILHLGRVWDRAQLIFTSPIDRLISFGRGLATGIIGIIKNAILRPLARLAQGTRGWDLLTAVLGQNPITGEPVQRNAETLIGGFMRLIGQEEVWQNIQRARAIPRAWAWFQGALEGLMGFVRDIPARFVAELGQLEVIDIVLLPRAFMRIGRVFASFLGSFLSWAGNQVLGLLQIIFEVVAPRAMPYVQRAAGALSTIFRNPSGFAHNLVRAGVQGFRQFKDNFLNHLRRSLIEWLTGAMSGTGIYIPQAINLREIIKFVLSVLGLTWQNLRVKLVRAIGAPAVSVLETTFDLVMRLVREGPAAAWERIRESISNLRETVMGQIMTFVRERIVVAAIEMLASSLIPGAGFIRAIISIYDTVMFFVERASQIAQTVAAYIDSLAAIASGNIGAAANRVEATMARTLTIIISFLASVMRIGRVTDAVMGVVNQLRQPIDRALDRVAEWIRERAQSLLQRAAGGTPQERLDRALAAAQRAVNRFAGRRVGALVLRPLLAVIRFRYQLQTLEAVQRGNLWAVRGVVNPAREQRTNAQVESADGNVKALVDRELSARLRSPVTDHAAFRSIVIEVGNRYRAQGLRSITVRRARNSLSEFEILLEASAQQQAQQKALNAKIRSVLSIGLREINLRQPTTGLTAGLQVGSQYHDLRHMTSRGQEHAETRLIRIILNRRWTGLADRNQSNTLVIHITRSPCPACTQRLNDYVASRRNEGYPVALEIHAASMYTPDENAGAGESAQGLQELIIRSQARISPWDIIGSLQSLGVDTSQIPEDMRTRLSSKFSEIEGEIELMDEHFRFFER